MRESGKDGRKIYCSEEELIQVKQFLKQIRDGNTESKLDTIIAELADLKSEINVLRSYSIRELEQKISKLENKLEQLGNCNY